ncbi:serine/threonine-protein kinase [Nannocystis radixulma]|uniref:Protein kinase n=1 Tax=Nannocystis radixulma TaxID=2995305 RepID=A0ABT5BKJ4_9BACT|nr:serine/threonine-protein kinase [Nannocystis radixulma]MDC0673476.1 protein kinase [Nannocystis radixulma]
MVERVRDTAEVERDSEDPSRISHADTLSSAGARKADAQPTADDLPADVRLGRFTLLRVLGRGGMGVVYTAYDELLDRIVAIKMVRSDRDDQHLLARVLREAKALAKLSHPNVVQIHDVSESDGQVFIAMEYVDGPTLRAWVQGRREAGAGCRELMATLIEAGRGLAAAHAAGLVHRDFKPDNVLVGADGRARVLDFGLVAARGEPEPRRPGSPLDSAELLTRTGAILGTPAYMSPEQWLGRPADARSDQYSFCAAVYEALHGVRPFAGGTPTEVLAAISQVSLESSAHALAVPTPIAAALRRGLSFRPDARFPDMTALLAALDHDPAASRRRWRRIAGVALVTAVFVIAAVLLAQGLQQRWRRDQREDDAVAALAQLEARIGESRAGGDRIAAARMFAAFLDEPAYRDTAAIARAWLAEAGRRGDDGDRRAAISALARAFTLAHDPKDSKEALLGLVGLFRGELEWDGLAQVLALLDERHPEAAGDLTLASVRGDVALARHDFAAAAARLAGPRRELASALNSARRAEFADVHQVYGRVGDEVWLLARGVGAPVLHAAKAEASLAPLWRHPFPLDTGRVELVDPLGGYVIAQEDTLALYGPAAGGGLERLYTWPERQVYAAAAADLDGDGAREMYVGTGSSCQITKIERDPQGAFTRRTVYDVGDSVESVVHSMLAVDLDRDGREELVVAFAGWRAYDVRVLRAAPGTGKLVAVARDKIGQAFGLGAVRDGKGEVRVVAEVFHREPNPLVFAPEQPFGAPAGNYLLALDGDRLVRRAHVPFVIDDAGAKADGVHWYPLVGDADGDGRGDFVNHYFERGVFHSVVQLQDERGGFVPAVLDGIQVLQLVQLDDDPAAELLANVFDASGASDLWLLGAGGETLPVRPPVHEDMSDRSMVRDAALRRAFAGADDLRRLGLFADAAGAYEELARRVPPGELRRGVLVDAAGLRERLGDDAAALALYREADDGARTTAALQGVFRSHLRLGEYDRALRALESLRTRPELAPGDAAVLLEQRDRLVRAAFDHPPIDVGFDRPLAPAWTIRDPLALRRRPLSQTLEFRTTVPGPLAELPLEWDGETIDVSIDLTVEHTEWSSQLLLDLVPEAEPERPVLRLGVMTHGTSRGGQPTLREYQCHAGRRVFFVNHVPALLPADPSTRSRVRLRMFAVAPLDELGCALTDLDRDESRIQRDRLTARIGPPGRYKLVLRAAGDVPAWLSAQIHHVAVRGARLVDPPTADPRRVALVNAAVEGEAVATLAALAEVGPADAREQALQALLLVQTGRAAEAVPLWQALLAAGEDAAARGALHTLLRGHHAEVGPVLRAISEPRYLDLLAEAWRNTGVNHLDDPRVAPVFLDILAGLAPERLAGPGSSAAEMLRAADLLTWRARLLVRARKPAAAREDFARALELCRRADQAVSLRASLLLLELASLAAKDGDRTTAGAHVEAARAASTMPLLVDDIVRARAELAGLTGA